MESNEIRVFIADDHPVFRSGLTFIIARDSQIKIVGEADNGEDAIAGLQTCGAQVAVLDIDMPRKDGFQVAREIRQMGLPVEIIFLTMHKDERFFNSALDLGVKGFLIKESAVEEIIKCIKTVAEGREHFSPAISAFLLKRVRRAENAGQSPSLSLLTPTERKVLKYIAEYKTSKEIADELFISIKTVENHRTNITQKLDLHGRNALIKFATEHKTEI